MLTDPIDDRLSAFRADVLDILIRREGLSRPAAEQAADVIGAHVATYYSEAPGWQLWQAAWDSSRERDWLKDVQRCAKALEEVLGRPRTLPASTPQAVADSVLLPQKMDMYGLSRGVPWLQELQQETVRILEKRRRPPSERHRPKDRWLHQLEWDVAFDVREAGVRLTKAKSGTLALIFERLHAEIGLPVHDPHKAVRRACDRLATTASTAPELPRTKT